MKNKNKSWEWRIIAVVLIALLSISIASFVLSEDGAESSGSDTGSDSSSSDSEDSGDSGGSSESSDSDDSDSGSDSGGDSEEESSSDSTSDSDSSEEDSNDSDVEEISEETEDSQDSNEEEVEEEYSAEVDEETEVEEPEEDVEEEVDEENNDSEDESEENSDEPTENENEEEVDEEYDAEVGNETQVEEPTEEPEDDYDAEVDEETEVEEPEEDVEDKETEEEVEEEYDAEVGNETQVEEIEDVEIVNETVDDALLEETLKITESIWKQLELEKASDSEIQGKIELFRTILEYQKSKDGKARIIDDIKNSTQENLSSENKTEDILNITERENLTIEINESIIEDIPINTTEENFTEEINLTEINVSVNETVPYNVSENKTVINETGYFNWTRSITNSYGDEAESMIINIKLPRKLRGEVLELSNIEKSFSTKNRGSMNIRIKDIKKKIGERFEEAEIKPSVGPINRIIFRNLRIKEDIISIGMKELNDPVYLNGYAIDPTELSFNDATVHVKEAKGRALFKCKDWNYSEENCFGEWKKVMNLKPGEPYEFLLTPDDPAFTEELPFDNCAAEDKELTKGTFEDSCDYPSGNSLYDGGTIETHNYGYTGWFGGADNLYGGIEVQGHKDNVNDCENILSVNICYEWWVSANPTECDISVDADNGTSYSTVSSTCPGTTENPGLICTDITSTESWTCSHFFGNSAVYAYAKSELTRTDSILESTENAIWDALFFNVTYNATNYAPTWNNNKTFPNSGTSYSQGTSYQFNVSWSDTYAMDSVWVEHNFTGTIQNYSITGNNDDEYYYNYEDLGAGEYYWKMYGNDSDGLINETDEWEYIVNKNSGLLDLLFNGTEGDISIYEGEYLNITTKMSNPENGYLLLYENSSLINEGEGFVENISQYNEQGEYNITALFNGNSNYTNYEKSYFITVQSSAETDAPVINIITPIENSKTKATLIYLNVSTNEPANCRYSTVENFSYGSGSEMDISGSQIHKKSLTGIGEGNYTYFVKCNDTLGNINNNDTQKSVNFTVDRTPPEPASEINSTSSGYDWIFWKWNNPNDEDFETVKIYLESISVLSANITEYNATGLLPSREYSLNVRTEDDVGNLNGEYIGNTTSTLTDNPPSINNIKTYPEISYGEMVNITTNITDDRDLIDSVWVDIDGSIYEMENTGGDQFYYYNWSAPPGSKVYSYTVYANDSYSTSSEQDTFIVIKPEENTYYEHLNINILNSTTYLESQVENSVSFGAGVETLGWTFTQDEDIKKGGMLISAGDIDFSGGFRKSGLFDPSVVYINWKLIDLNQTNGETEICRSPTGTSGKLVDSRNNIVLKDSCSLLSNYYVAPGHKIRVKIYGNNTDTTARTIFHRWDTSPSGSSHIIEKIDLGNVSTHLGNEDNSSYMLNRSTFNINCTTFCYGGACIDINLTVESKEESGSWNRVTDASKPIVLNGSKDNPYDLGGLVGNLTASFKVKGSKEANNTLVRCVANDRYGSKQYSNYITINITPEDKFAPLITNIENYSITDSQSYVSWNTDENANSTVEYGASTSLGFIKDNSGLTTSHNILLDNLNPTTTYFYRVKSCDEYFNCNTSGIYNFTTDDEPDLTAPIISDIESSASIITANISWLTDENANSTVEYGITTGLGESLSESSYKLNRTILISSLLDNTTYFYKVKSCDASGNCDVSDILNFTTNMDYPPSLNGTNPNNSTTITQYAPVSISGKVIDDVGLSYVWTTIELPNGTFKNITLSDGNMDDIFDNQYFTEILGRHNFTIYANDTKGQINTSKGYFIVVEDATPPSIISFSDYPEPVLIDEIVNIIANITDNVEVDSAWVEINGSNNSMRLKDIYDNKTDLVSTTCYDSEFANGDTYEIYSAWNIKGSGKANITSLWYWQHDDSLTSAEEIEMAIYYPNGSLISGSIINISGTGVQGWVSGNYSKSFEIELGDTYYIAVGPVTGSYDLPRDADSDCPLYLPNEGTYYATSGGGLDSEVPFGTQTGNHYIIPGVSYDILNYSFWQYSLNTTGLPIDLTPYRIFANDSAGNIADPTSGIINLTVNSSNLIISSLELDFKDVVPNSIYDIVNSIMIRNTGLKNPLEGLNASFTSNSSDVYGMISGENIINGSRFALNNTYLSAYNESTEIISNDSLSPGFNKNISARLDVPPYQPSGHYLGEILISWIS